MAQYATARIRVVLVNINTAYRLAELEYALNKVQCKGLISAPSFKTINYLGMLQTLAPELAQCVPGELQASRLPHLRCVIRMDVQPSAGMFNLRQLMVVADAQTTADARGVGAALNPNDAVNVQFTSGSTGHPKGAR